MGVRWGVEDVSVTMMTTRQISMAPVGEHQLDPGLTGQVRHLLDLAARISGLTNTFLTAIDWADEFQQVLVSHTVGGATGVPEGMCVPWEHTVSRRTMDAELPALVDVQEQFPDCIEAELLDVRTYVSVPVVDARGTVLGSFCGSSTDQIDLGADVVTTFGAFAEIVALHLRDVAAQREIDRLKTALASAEHRLQELALTDELTGLPNRRGVLEALDRLSAAARRRSSRLSAIWIDVDGFRTINECHGNAAGDEALRTLAENLRAVLRGEDVAGRMGGDDFVVLLPDTDATGAAVVVERLRARLGRDRRGGRGPLSFHAGVACGDGYLPEAILLAADDALFAARTVDRGRVAVT